MRTDSPALSNTALTAARSLVESVFGEEFLSPLKKVSPPVVKVLSATVADEKGIKSKEKNDIDDSNSNKDKDNLAPKNAQNAHEAIRPAEVDGKVK